MYKCPEASCQECLSYNYTEERGVCTNCAPNYELVDERCNILCSDGLQDANEECDDKNLENEDGCSSECKVEFNYWCIGFPSNCTFIFVCGNGVLEPKTEECDDGNNIDDDFCSNKCTINTDS